MKCTVEDVRNFITTSKRDRENWFTNAQRSWDEIKKRRKNHRLWSVTPNSLRKRARYPAWYSIFKIRQPLILSRVGIPIGRDTTQDGTDNIGAVAAVLLERLAVNLAKSFDFFDVMCAARDDFLATCFGTVRAYYERDEIKQEVKEYITPQKNEAGEAIFVDGAGNEVMTDEIYQDDMGYFIETEKTIDVENERVCLEPVLYSTIYVDPYIRRWNRCKRLAFELSYSPEEFKEIFGFQAYLDTCAQMKKLGDDQDFQKVQCIKVYEYWDAYEKETLWLTDYSADFIRPKDYYLPDDASEKGEEETNGLYNLAKFFPCPPPLMMNQSTDEFWPVPEFYQLIEIFEDIHTIFSRMVALTRAIRSRLLFDNNVESLQEALNEAAEGDAFGVPNLAQSLQAAGGDLSSVVQYIPVEQMINGLNQLYQALEQRLNTVYRLTGTSDMLQGLAQDQTQRTFGERQMTEKYALNQLAEPQRKMQEFVRDSYQLLCEMALKNFKDSSLDEYIVPQTLQADYQEKYRAALGMLKSDHKRFRIELETDSTIALNEQYDKQVRMELVQTLTQSLEKVAGIAQTQPGLVAINLHAMKYLIQGFRQSKMFQSEINEAINNVIKQTEAPQPPQFNKDEAEAQFKDRELQFRAVEARTNAQLKQIDIANSGQLKQMELNATQQIEIAKLEQNERLNQIQTQIELFRAQGEQAIKSGDQQIKAGDQQIALQKISADIQLAREELATKREALMLEMSKIASDKELKEFALAIDSHVASSEIALAQNEQRLQEINMESDNAEKWATENRLAAEHEMGQVRTRLDIAAKIKDIRTPMPGKVEIKPIKSEKRVKLSKDKSGGLKSLDMYTREG